LLNFFFKNTFFLHNLVFIYTSQRFKKLTFERLQKNLFFTKKRKFSYFCFLKKIKFIKNEELFYLKNKQFLFKKSYRFFNKNKIRNFNTTLLDFFKLGKKHVTKLNSNLLFRLRWANYRPDYDYKYSYLNTKYFWDSSLLKARNKLNFIIKKDLFQKKYFFRQTNPFFFFSSYVFFKIINIIVYFKLISSFNVFSFSRAAGFLNLKVNQTYISNNNYILNIFDHITLTLDAKKLKFWILRMSNIQLKVFNFYFFKNLKKKGFFFKKRLKKNRKLRYNTKFVWWKQYVNNLEKILPTVYLLNFELNFLNLSIFLIQKLNYSFYNWYVYNVVRIFNWRSYNWQLKKRKLFKGI
jgi:hypothetical protein